MSNDANTHPEVARSKEQEVADLMAAVGMGDEKGRHTVTTPDGEPNLCLYQRTDEDVALLAAKAGVGTEEMLDRLARMDAPPADVTPPAMECPAWCEVEDCAWTWSFGQFERYHVRTLATVPIVDPEPVEQRHEVYVRVWQSSVFELDEHGLTVYPPKIRMDGDPGDAMDAESAVALMKALHHAAELLDAINLQGKLWIDARTGCNCAVDPCGTCMEREPEWTTPPEWHPDHGKG